jgi:hypothetical protein
MKRSPSSSDKVRRVAGGSTLRRDHCIRMHVKVFSGLRTKGTSYASANPCGLRQACARSDEQNAVRRGHSYAFGAISRNMSRALHVACFSAEAWQCPCARSPRIARFVPAATGGPAHAVEVTTR